MKNLFAGSNYSAQHWSLFCCEEDYCRRVASSRKSTNRRRSAAFTNCKTAFTPFVRQIKNVENQFVVRRLRCFKICMDPTEGGLLQDGVHFREEILFGNLCDHLDTFVLSFVWCWLLCGGWQTGLESGRHPWRLSDWAGRKCGTSREPRHHLQTQKRCGGGALSCWVTSTVCCKVGLLFQLKDSKALRGTLRGFLGSFPNIQV